jgi:hypothetical protein
MAARAQTRLVSRFSDQGMLVAEFHDIAGDMLVAVAIAQ